MDNIKDFIASGAAVLGIEFGSTRIKAVLVDNFGNPLAQGSHEWENRFDNGMWTYSLDDIHKGLQKCYADLCADVLEKYGVTITSLASIGVSAMMHGYMAFDKEGKLLAPFRTWRNTNTVEAAGELSRLFDFNIPLRWSISHLYQAILDKEPHVKDIAFQTTLAGYIHLLLTGEKVLGVGDASGMMPVDPTTKNYNAAMVGKFEALIESKGYKLKINEIFPKVLPAGAHAGNLTPEGALLIDPTGSLKSGTPMCPPEGDAGTGMVATNAVRIRTGNVSAGTSSFSMIVLEKELGKPYEAIDIVTTPDGLPVAMVHCNNCTSDLNSWVGIFDEFCSVLGVSIDISDLYGHLYKHALAGDDDCGGIVTYNFFSGEPIAGITEGGVPMVLRKVGDRFNLANFMRANLNAAVACLKIGNEILFVEEKVEVDRLTGHGGFFKTPEVGQRILSAALGTPISVMSTAGEGGAWGMALLALFMIEGKDLDLPAYLDAKIFKNAVSTTLCATQEEIEGFSRYLDNFKDCLGVEKEAVKLKK